MCAMVLEGITGFGSTVIAMPLVTLLIPIKTAVPLLSLMSLGFSVYMFLTNRRFINKRVLGTIMLFAGVGFPIGMLLFGVMEEKPLKLLLGVFVTFCAVQALFGMGKKLAEGKNAESRLGRIAKRVMLFFGGLFQGAFACGGPLIVIYTHSVISSKDEFRATMSSVWLILNTVLLIKNIAVGGIITGDFLLLLLKVLPFWAIGAFVGNLLHKKASIKSFTLITNLILLAAGVIALATALTK